MTRKTNHLFDRITVEEWDALISKIYEAGLSPELWDGTLKAIAATVNAHSGHLIVIDKVTGNPLYQQFSGLPEKVEEEFNSYLPEARNPRVNASIPADEGSIIVDHMHSSENDIKNDPFYQEFLKPYEADYYSGLILSQTSNRFCAAAISRNKKAGHFNEMETAFLKKIMPHMKRSIELMRIMGIQGAINGIEETLLKLPNPTLLLNSKGYIEAMNKPAEKIIRRNDGIRAQDNTLYFSNKKIQKQFNSQLQSICQNNFSDMTPQTLQVKRDNNTVPYIVGMTPIKSRYDLFNDIGCLVYIVDESNNTPNLTELLQTHYGLTAKESLLAEALFKGASVKDYADEKSIKIDTVRFHLKNIFSKMDLKSQTDLIRVCAKLHYSTLAD